jgi:membrane-bound lytic murein transglycosylase
MKTTTALSLTVLLVAPLGTASLAACASDPNKRLEQASAQEAEANRVQREAQIDQTKQQEDTRLESIKPDTRGMPAASEQRAKAQSAMGEQRQKFENEARARIQKVQARLEESRQKLQLGGGDVPTSIQDKLGQTARLTESLSNQIAHVAQVGDDKWSSEKKRLEEQLEDLEKSAADVKSDADRYPR